MSYICELLKMRLVIQRVSQAYINIHEKRHATISAGMVILLGVAQDDTNEDIDWLTHKVMSLRIFGDHEDKMNLSIQDIHGEFLVISQFTLHASTKKGNRPSFISAAKPEIAVPLYELFVNKLKAISRLKVSTGVFAEDMKVNLTNEGPVTIIIDSKQRE